ncbi:MAG: hypothetical protein K6E99_05965 [Bacilli bacterium]|nr:hypothetical protein [Bacilli bacterium]
MKNNKEEKSTWEKFKYNYDHLEGFDSLVKIVLFFAICLVIILVAKTTLNQERKEENTNVTTTSTNEQSSLKGILDTLIKKEATIKVTKGDYVAVVKKVKESNGEITGLIQDNSKQLKEFKISEQKVYEIVLDEEIENEELFKEINTNFVIPSVLVGILEDTNGKNANKATKTTNSLFFISFFLSYIILLFI